MGAVVSVRHGDYKFTCGGWLPLRSCWVQPFVSLRGARMKPRVLRLSNGNAATAGPSTDGCASLRMN